MKKIIEPIIKTRKLTVGIFTPSSPDNVMYSQKFDHALNELVLSGFNFKLGELTKNKSFQGYRAGDSEKRAEEFMQLIEDDSVDILMPTAGGEVSSSILSYLDYGKIRKARKLITGFSDASAIHMAILSQSKLKTMYGPSLVPVFGDWPKISGYSLNSFFRCIGSSQENLNPPKLSSNQDQNSSETAWKDKHRVYKNNLGWKFLRAGSCIGYLLITNLSSLLSLSGTKFFPEIKNKILVLEQSDINLSEQERQFNHLKNLNIFRQIKALVISKSKNNDTEEYQKKYEDIILEFVDNHKIPIVMEFDCGHTFPMLSIMQNSLCEISGTNKPEIKLLN